MGEIFPGICYYINMLLFKKDFFKVDVDKKIVNSFISIMVLIELIKLLSLITV